MTPLQTVTKLTLSSLALFAMCPRKNACISLNACG